MQNLLKACSFRLKALGASTFRNESKKAAWSQRHLLDHDVVSLGGQDGTKHAEVLLHGRGIRSQTIERSAPIAPGR